MSKVDSDEELKTAAAAILGLERDEVDPGDFWRCPGCGQISSHVPNNCEAMPMTWGDAYSTSCGHCRQSFAPRQLDDGSDNPILAPVYTHDEEVS